MEGRQFERRGKQYCEINLVVVLLLCEKLQWQSKFMHYNLGLLLGQSDFSCLWLSKKVTTISSLLHFGLTASWEFFHGVKTIQIEAFTKIYSMHKHPLGGFHIMFSHQFYRTVIRSTVEQFLFVPTPRQLALTDSSTVGQGHPERRSWKQEQFF